MALINADILHPFDGGRGEWRTTYADVPSAYATWGEAIDAIIAASPFNSDTLTEAWVYVQLYTELGEAERSIRLGSFSVAYATPPPNRLAYWERQLRALRLGSAETMSVPVTVTL